AQSFPKETLDLKHPLTDVFRNLARTSTSNFAGHPDNRSYNLPVEQFVGGARSELLYLSLPAGHAELAGSFARSRWRESWVRGEAGDDTNDIVKLTAAAQSKQSYLAMVDRILTVGSRFQTWAIECRDLGLASARDLSDLIKSHRPVRATYSKDLTEVAGGHRNYIIVADLD
ncbi:MAG TPA: hypothetical protein VJX67_06150, partial [Blastocatellia bacterium]|nr:hypothetical protein [Blastocatellia bacterium]